MDVLLLLVMAEGRLVTRRELLRRAWPETLASDESLTRCVADLRKLLKEEGNDASLIETVSKRGYRVRQSALSGHENEGSHNSALIRPEKWAIVVIPFSSEDNSQHEDYLAEGVSDEILSLLSKSPELRVIARSSASRFNYHDDISEIAGLLNVDYVLKGAIRRTRHSFRLSLELINTDSGEAKWSGPVDCALDEIPMLHENASRIVLEQLGVSLQWDGANKKNPSPKAHMLMLKGRHLANLVTPEGWKQSNDHFNEVLLVEPEHSEAWAGMAKNYALEACDAQRTFAEGFALARASVNRALEINPQCALSLSVDGWLNLYDSIDHEAAARSFQRALRYEPYNTDTLLEVSHLARALGRMSLARRICQFVVSRDPVNAKAYRYLGICHRLEGDFDLAVEAFGTALQLSPSISSGHVLLAYVLNESGDPHAALAEVAKESSELWTLIGRSIVYFSLGMQSESDSALKQLMSKNERAAAYNAAYIEAYRGRTDQAFYWLHKAREYRDPGIAHFVTERFFNNIRHDPRWQGLLEQTGQSEERLSAIELTVTLPSDQSAAGPD